MANARSRRRDQVRRGRHVPFIFPLINKSAGIWLIGIDMNAKTVSHRALHSPGDDVDAVMFALRECARAKCNARDIRFRCRVSVYELVPSFGSARVLDGLIIAHGDSPASSASRIEDRSCASVQPKRISGFRQLRNEATTDESFFSDRDSRDDNPGAHSTFPKKITSVAFPSLPKARRMPTRHFRETRVTGRADLYRETCAGFYNRSGITQRAK